VSTNGERARRWFTEVWVPGGEATVRELMGADSIGYMEGSEVRGHEEFLAQRLQLLSVFPDLAISVEDVIEEGAKVAVRWHVTATHGGDGLGVPPTNRPVSFRGITWFEFDGGQIVRGWDSWNLGGVMQSLTAPAG
jgi:steroid delta-isomerase-like uncharacterized protein